MGRQGIVVVPVSVTWYRVPRQIDLEPIRSPLISICVDDCASDGNRRC
ncbi:MAG: hypothetical protein R3C04_05695 [Hyphomonas sp.]